MELGGGGGKSEILGSDVVSYEQCDARLRAGRTVR